MKKSITQTLLKSLKVKNNMSKFLIVLISVISTTAQAQNLSFKDVWKEIQKNSSVLESARFQTESAQASQIKAGRHWLPKIYIDAKSYQTNDPGSSFFGLLQQRSLLATDFNPDAINHPETKNYTRGALGIDLPLFEGGFKSAQSDIMNFSFNAQKYTEQQNELDLYSQAAQSFAIIAISEKQQNKMSQLKSVIEKLIKNYQLGQKSNAVGYSGLLGMKSLLNRLNGLTSQSQAKINSYYKTLEEFGLSQKKWKPFFTDSLSFSEKYLTSKKLGPSYKTQALNQNTIATESMIDMQQARFLPRIGAFAESSLFNSDRDTAQSYMAGLYLQWSLFDPADFGSKNEYRLKSMAMKKYSESMSKQELAQKNGLNEALNSYKENLKLINDSDKILEEQTKMSESLFRNGSINALQFVEILNRRTDLIMQQNDIEIGLIQTAAQLMALQDSSIENNLKDQKD
jgi:outer membrane protein TolC